MEYFTLNIVGLTRKLPIVAISRNTHLASFNILGDVELVDRLADELTKRLKDFEFDYLVAPEVKVVPLVHGISKRLGKPRYVICRKSAKGYMVSPTIIKPLPYFPKHARPLVLDGPDRELLSGKRVTIVDDVVSTGITMRMMGKLMDIAGAKVVARAVVLKQGDTQFDSIDDLIYLGEIPIFKNTS